MRYLWVTAVANVVVCWKAPFLHMESLVSHDCDDANTCRSPDRRSREFLLRSDVLPGLVGHLASREEMPAEMAAEIIAELCNERRCRYDVHAAVHLCSCVSVSV
jgi:hypothetical protein